jgi:non-specific serine/threonine protein kinase/serine/threonine-protein kinase
MGVVYHAQQLRPIRRDVALKIIKPGMDSQQVISRFGAERQALALMDHPNIARVLDAGATTSGLPFFVMELVDGIPITRYCDSKRLSIVSRIELFLPACKAIQHAHQKGIIHRDIKPSNILVAEQEGKPAPKVIDFGLAKALGQELSDATRLTNLGTIVGTLDYMSPEQADIARHDVDTRSDVYSLGAVLYELLTGATPLECGRLANAGYMEALQRIRDEETPTPSSRLRQSTASAEIATQRQSDIGRLPKLLQGELDWIIMKALEKDRTRRYETVNALARDLERHLAGEPVEAAPPSTAYKVRKFVRKHRAGLALAGVAATLLVAGIVSTSWMAIRAGRAEREARAVSDFLRNDVLAQAGAGSQAAKGGKPDPEVKVRTALDQAAAGIEGKFGAQPEVEAAIRFTIGEAYLEIGVYAQAERQMERALELRRRIFGAEHPDTIAALGGLAQIYMEEGRFAEAEATAEKALETEQHKAGALHPDTLASMDALARIYQRHGKFTGAEPLARQAVEGLERKLGASDAKTITAMHDLGSIYAEQGKYEQAEPMFRKALAGQQSRFGADHPDTLGILSDLADMLDRQHRRAEAIAIESQLLDACRRVFGPEHPNTLVVMSNLAVSYSDQKEYAESEALNRQTKEIMDRVLGLDNPRTLIVTNNLGVACKTTGKYADAEAIDRRNAATCLRVLGPDHPTTLASRSNLALDHFYLGEHGEAETEFRALLEVRRRKPGTEDPVTLRTAYNLARTLSAEGKYQEAEKLLRETLRVYGSKMRDSWERPRCQALLGAVLAAEHKGGEAELLLADGVRGLLERESDIAWYGAGDADRALLQLIRLYRQEGKPREAAEWETKLAARLKQPGR